MSAMADASSGEFSVSSKVFLPFKAVTNALLNPLPKIACSIIW